MQLIIAYDDNLIFHNKHCTPVRLHSRKSYDVVIMQWRDNRTDRGLAITCLAMYISDYLILCFQSRLRLLNNAASIR